MRTRAIACVQAHMYIYAYAYPYTCMRIAYALVLDVACAFVWTLGGRTGIREPGTPKGPCVSVTLACPGIGAVLPTVSPGSSAVRHVPADRVVVPLRAQHVHTHGCGRGWRLGRSWIQGLPGV